MARRADYDKKIEAVKKKIEDKESQLKALRKQLKDLEAAKGQDDMKELNAYIQECNMTPAEILEMLKNK